jgi:hypothetical protein
MLSDLFVGLIYIYITERLEPTFLWIPSWHLNISVMKCQNGMLKIQTIVLRNFSSRIFPFQ